MGLWASLMQMLQRDLAHQIRIALQTGKETVLGLGLGHKHGHTINRMRASRSSQLKQTG
jgi:hypothetical protein